MKQVKTMKFPHSNEVYEIIDAKAREDIENLKNNITIEETDPTVPAWAKEPEKPSYTADDVGARPADWMPTPADIGLKTEQWTFTYEDGTVETKVVYVG